MVSYTYDAWGNPTSCTGSLAGTIGQKNPFRYRGYYYDTESGLYYLNSRYYDPEVGRFVSEDSYISTGQGLLGHNMFAYCGNNPVNRFDSGGCFWNEIWEFTKTAISEIGKAINSLSPAYASCSGAAIADGPFVIGDTVGLIGAAFLTIGAIGYGTYQATQKPSNSVSQTQEREKVIAVPEKSKKQAFFTVDPYDFHPNGLVMREFAGTKNGRIIEWRHPILKAKIFEWNEDYVNGPHYHVLMVEWDGKHDGKHYLAGTPVPEPWNSLYFGG